MLNSASKLLTVLVCSSLLLTACKLPGEKDSSSSNNDGQKPSAPIEVTPPVEPTIPKEPTAPTEPEVINPLVDTARFDKINEAGASLNSEQQLLDMNIEPWACVQDKNADLIWQVPQANGNFAFNNNYYWADRTTNHRDYSIAQCGLLTTGGQPIDCNTNALIQRANDLKLCGKTDWRLASRKEFNSLLDKKYANDDENLAPINSFYFPFVSANGGELYWGNELKYYPNGHDQPAVENDWQGSNKLVGSAYGVWMDSDYSNVKAPPRSANEPHFAMLVSGEKIEAAMPELGNPDGSASTVEITQNMALEFIDDGVNENTVWQNRFIKIANQGQVLMDQQAEDWACMEDKLYKEAIDGLQDITIVWQRITDTEKVMNYAATVAYITDINTEKLCGRTDWRLPTEKELKSLLVTYNSPFGFVDMRAGYEASILNDTVVGRDGDSSYYWTSTNDQYTEAKKTAVSFQDSFAESSGEDKITSSYRVRLISTFSLSK
jgi:hypothetical protein